MREVCGGDGSSCTFNSNTFVKRLTQFGEFTHKFEAKSQSCVAHRQGCNDVDTCGALEECGHPVCFVHLSRLHSTTVITASEVTTSCAMESVPFNANVYLGECMLSRVSI